MPWVSHTMTKTKIPTQQTSVNELLIQHESVMEHVSMDADTSMDPGNSIDIIHIAMALIHNRITKIPTQQLTFDPAMKLSWNINQ
jgi:hypothetical protein